MIGCMATGTRTAGPLTDRVASLLRQQIAELRLSAAEVSRSSGIPPATLSRLLAGQRPIYLEQLDALCAVLNLDMGWLLDEADRQARGRQRLISVAMADTPPAGAAPRRDSRTRPSRQAHGQTPADAQGDTGTRSRSKG